MVGWGNVALTLEFSTMHFSNDAKLRFGPGTGRDGKRGFEMTPVYAFSVTPVAADADGIMASQALNAGAAPNFNGAIGATLDVARALVAAWTGTAVLTVTGTDINGDTVVESSASGTSFTGKKAFKTITNVSVSSNVTGLTLGTGDVLGLPYRADAGDVFIVKQGTATDAATVVAADTTSPATATTGDTRGTVDPAAALNGSTKITVLMRIADPSKRSGAHGVAQYAG